MWICSELIPLQTKGAPSLIICDYIGLNLKEHYDGDL